MKYLMLLIPIFFISCAGIKTEEGCKKDFHSENSKCISNIKMVDCVENFKPYNSDFVKRKVKLFWDKEWSRADDCFSKCKDGYVRTEYGCEKFRNE